MLGIGLTPEGIDQNDIIYEFVMETAWNQESMDVNKWVADYSIRRYGVNNEQIIKAWNYLQVNFTLNNSLSLIYA